MFSRMRVIAPTFFKPNMASFLRSSQRSSFSTQRFPSTVDLNLLGRCNLNCAWCWGPEHDATEPIRLDEWKTIVAKLQQLGTKNVIITGG